MAQPGDGGGSGGSGAVPGSTLPLAANFGPPAGPSPFGPPGLQPPPAVIQYYPLGLGFLLATQPGFPPAPQPTPGGPLHSGGLPPPNLFILDPTRPPQLTSGPLLQLPFLLDPTRPPQLTSGAGGPSLAFPGLPSTPVRPYGPSSPTVPGALGNTLGNLTPQNVAPLLQEPSLFPPGFQEPTVSQVPARPPLPAAPQVPVGPPPRPLPPAAPPSLGVGLGLPPFGGIRLLSPEETAALDAELTGNFARSGLAAGSVEGLLSGPLAPYTPPVDQPPSYLDGTMPRYFQ